MNERGPVKGWINRRFGSEADVEQLTGFSRRTLQKDRLLGRNRFPWYKVGGKILYDIAEVEATIRASAGRGGEVGARRRPAANIPGSARQTLKLCSVSSTTCGAAMAIRYAQLRAMRRRA